MKKSRKPSPSRQQRSSINEKLVSDLLRIQFHTELADQKLHQIGFLSDELFCSTDTVFDILFEHVFKTSHRINKCSDDLSNAWGEFIQRFENEQQFDPAEFVAWLAAGKLRSHPFNGAAKGIWLRAGAPGICVKCPDCGHKWMEVEWDSAVPLLKDRVFKCMECGHSFRYEKGNCL